MNFWLYHKFYLICGAAIITQFYEFKRYKIMIYTNKIVYALILIFTNVITPS